MKKVLGASLGLLVLGGVARGDGGPSAADAGPDGGPDAGIDLGAEPEPPLQVCLCSLHIAAAEQPALPAVAPALNSEAVRARVLAGLPAHLRDRLS